MMKYFKFKSIEQQQEKAVRVNIYWHREDS